MTAIKNILYIEDDVFIGEMYARSLRKAGYQVDLISNGQEGLKAATTQQYDLILLDILLPETHGPKILEALRSPGNDLVPHSRIIVLTNFSQNDESRAAMQSKVDGYLIKADITPRKLIEIIQSLQTA